jgi:poly(ADP-ribose) glycohydrolase ARH3
MKSCILTHLGLRPQEDIIHNEASRGQQGGDSILYNELPGNWESGMRKRALVSKFLGSLVGTAVGDALGAPFEGCYRVSIEEIKLAAEKRRILIYTDDTHMMIGVAQSLVRCKGFDGGDMAQTFIRNYELDPFRGYGPGPPRVFQLIKSGEPWDKAALSLYRGGSYGNGAAMRIAPVGVFYHDRPEALEDVTHKSSQITHAHNLGREGAVLQAHAIALATNLEPSSPFSRGDFLARLATYSKEDIYRARLGKMEALLGEKDKGRIVAELGNGIEAFNSVPAAIFSFLLHYDSFSEAVLDAISLGGDTDTIGAMTGAISGAYLGVESIPDAWKEKLEDMSYIEELAKTLHSLKS